MSTDSDILAFLSYLVIAIAVITTLGVVWMWSLYIGPDNPRPRSRLLLVLCLKSTLIMVAEIVLAYLAVRRLQGEPTLGVAGGLILVVVIVVLETAHFITMGYLISVRRLRARTTGKRTPPPFGPDD